jgi:hypothetical protein
MNYYTWEEQEPLTPEITLEGSTFLIKERNGSNRLNLDVLDVGDYDI